ncbi:TonB-dependent receptor [Colwellia sp. Bg11-28]|uniref:TonB-dependent receptor n=1 Tax=Colwellia sp. Bg11-28 TaxID=2058305 RepID=UPI000C33D20B|nr:TonB-dependent receptor [Colwellia sp. Bg11-28]PKH86680.1 TonB-dependent receptor [Colwellia sp. Bg11-28]
MSKKIFTKTRIATSLSLILGVTALPAISAEEASLKDSDEIEIIAVTGMLSSIKESTRIKRDASGVVDAISAEDIGKFPDTNLAESLQRITGVSIDRTNGEGSKVTVRGFGPDFNMVTLNGRTMPASGLPAGGGVANSRAFEFSNLASDAVKSVSVYKTGKANIATGGIGAVIDIVTGKPLDNPGMHVSVGAKALMDTSNRVGDDVTPELSGLFSWTDDDEMFGASLTVNTQERHSSTSGAFVNQWRTGAFDGTIPQAADDIQLNNAPDIGQLYSMPSDLRYFITDQERERTNAQLTLQFRPVESLTATLDYTYSKQDTFQARAEQSIWMDTYKSSLGFDDETTATPIDYNEDRGDQPPRDLGLAQQELNQVNENDSIGLNISYDVNDYFNITFDGHSSTADSSPDAEYGSWVNAGLGANISAGQGVDFSNDYPTMRVDFDDCDPRRGLNCNGILDQDDVGTSILDMNYASQKTDINEFRLIGAYEFEEGSIEFGIESRSMESHSVQSLTRHTMGNWGVENPGELPADFLTPVNFTKEINDFDKNGAFNQGFTGSASQIGAWAAGEYGFDFVANGASATNRTIKEDITAAFFQLDLSGELGGRPYNISAGLRLESTDVTSSANVALPNAVAWEGNNDFNVRFGNGMQDFSADASYDHALPSFDFDIEVVDNVVARFSFSKTIARPTYDQLSAAASDVSGPTGPTSLPGVQLGTASNGNPGLLPLESNNIDLSAEWYFAETSYVSIGYYEKRVNNFAGRQPVEENVYGLRDATAGPRAQAAALALTALGEEITDTNLFAMVAATENNVDFYSMPAEDFEVQYDVLPNGEDPLMDFTVTKFVNNKEAKIDGFEFAVQHFFGETGFGFQANYTTVNGDVGFDNNGDPSVTQFALVGLSDTANLILMYENDDFQARIAYNWRDKFLNTQAQYINEPGYTEEYAQVDFNVAYQVTEQLSVFFEGINITGEDTRTHGRTTAQLWNLSEQEARYALGGRYTF